MNVRKSLGQHWLNDKTALTEICRAGEISVDDVVLEVGPGQGSLTRLLVAQAKKVIAVELDDGLAKNLTHQVSADNLQIVSQDILGFDLNQLPIDYKVIANIPYYLTSHLIRRLTSAENPPKKIVLLIQKEVAERICAKPGQMSLLSVSAQLHYDCSLGIIVPAKLFEPPPEVESQVVIMDRRIQPLFIELDEKAYFRVVKAGFGERRKMLRSSLSGGLGISKEQADQLLAKADMDGGRRAQELSLQDWHKLSLAYNS